MEPVVRRVAAAQTSASANSTAVTATYTVANPNTVSNFPDNTTEENSSIKSSMSDAQVKLIKFVETQIAKMNEHLLFNGQQPNISQLNQALSEYERMLFGHTSLYEMIRWNAVEANDIYDDWIARKSIMIRDQVNPANVAASKWYSAKEIEWLVISRFGDERAKLLANKRLAEHERSTVERLVEGWKSYGFILNQLSANARAELQGSGLHTDVDYDETD